MIREVCKLLLIGTVQHRLRIGIHHLFDRSCFLCGGLPLLTVRAGDLCTGRSTAEHIAEYRSAHAGSTQLECQRLCIRIPAAIVSIAGHYCHTAVVRCGICAAAHILQCSGTIVVSADTVAVQFHGTAQIVDRLCVVAQQQSLLARRQLVHQLLLFRIQHPCTGCQRLGQKGHAQCQRRKRCFQLS